jgi:coenzyme F420-reducing hydrogenase alpha subunit
VIFLMPEENRPLEERVPELPHIAPIRATEETLAGLPQAEERPQAWGRPAEPAGMRLAPSKEELESLWSKLQRAEEMTESGIHRLSEYLKRKGEERMQKTSEKVV